MWPNPQVELGIYDNLKLLLVWLRLRRAARSGAAGPRQATPTWGEGVVAAMVCVGLGRIVALRHCACTLYQIR